MNQLLDQQLSPDRVGDYRRSKVLRWTGAAGAEQLDPWMPRHVSARHPDYDYVVDCDGPHDPPVHFVRLQDAVDQALLDAKREHSKRRRSIKICPGTYDGPIYIPATAPPLLINGASRSAVTLAANIDAQMTGEEYRRRFAASFANAHPDVQDIFERIAAGEIVSTGNSSVLRIGSDDAIVAGLCVKNRYNCDRKAAALEGEVPDVEGRYVKGQHQAVALHVAGADRVHLHDLQLSSFQDTLYLQSPGAFSTARSLITDCDIEGDVDFIFGQATAFFENCEIRSRGLRGSLNWATAPATNIRTPYGFVFDKCRFTHDAEGPGGIADCFLGRQWFEGSRATPYVTKDGDRMLCVPGRISRAIGDGGEISKSTLEAVGKCIVLRSQIGPHINPYAPWSDWNGQLIGPTGQRLPFEWNAGFRPVQHSSTDFHAYLGDWLLEHGLDYSDVPLNVPWLAGFAAEPGGS